MKKRLILLLFLFIHIFIYGQNSHEVYLTITDTVVTLKENINTKRNRISYAAKVNIEINVPDLQEHDTIFLSRFNNYVSTVPFFGGENPFDSYKEYSIGLNYILEDINNNTLQSQAPIFERSLNNFVSSDLIIEHNYLNASEKVDYHSKIYEINNKSQSLELFPLIGDYHYLHKGEYYLYFVYAYNGLLIWGRPDEHDSKEFRGYIISNKIKLIVESEPESVKNAGKLRNRILKRRKI